MLSSSFKAWLAAAITAIQISLGSVGASTTQLVNYIADPFNVVYTWSEQDVDDYFDKANIQIVPGGTIIDGVTYDDVWLSHDASEIFRTNAFDFQTAYNIASESNGTFASGSGNILGLPAFHISTSTDRYCFTQYVRCPVGSSVSLAGYTLTNNGGYPVSYTITTPDGVTTSNAWYVSADDLGLGFRGDTITGASWVCSVEISRLNYNSRSSLPSGSYSTGSFSFDYISGSIPSDPVSDDEGIILHIPSNHPDSTLGQFLEEHPDFAQPGGVTLDPDLPDISDLLDAFDDLSSLIIPLIPVIQANFDVAPVSPVPVPETTIADTDYSYLDRILNTINNSISSIPSAISSLGDRILEDIEQGPIHVFDKVLDLISTVFAPVISLITSGLSIWSYVLAWLSQITVPFSFILSVVPAGVMVPIYAAIAGFLVIAIFRRFGR